MSGERMFEIRVPASTANLGPGFDSLGLALGLYLTIKGRVSDKWEVIPANRELEIFPKDETNYIVSQALKTAQRFGKELPPCRIEVVSDIPLTRGLGSSASAIVAGIEMANLLADLQLAKEEKWHLASLTEGHPDNAGASVAGGFTVGCQTGGSVRLLSFPIQGLRAVAVIPENEWDTESSRKALPAELPFERAVQSSAAANLLVASLLSGDWETAGHMMELDAFHQPYRGPYVPHLTEIAKAAKLAGAAGTALSGAGPSVLCLVRDAGADQLERELKRAFPAFTVLNVPFDQNGCQSSWVPAGSEYAAGR